MIHGGNSRLKIQHVMSRPSATLAEEVAAGLAASPRTLPPRFFYDGNGSLLFEKITALPEYYLTRAEQAILEDHAAEIVAAAGPRVAIVEFGSGSSTKTRLLIEAALARQETLHYVPIDISADFLEETAQDLLRSYPGLVITALAAEYHDAVREIPVTEEPRLILFLGSNIGNFEDADAAEFLRKIAQAMRPEDRLLVGFDLCKDPRVIEAAYNDSAGVTAQFNLNVLRRINEELGADFDLDAWRHHAPFVDERSRVEMLLVSERDQAVTVDALGRRYHFAAGEPIRTEVSTKYTLEAVTRLASSAGLLLERWWMDRQEDFGEVLLARESA